MSSGSTHFKSMFFMACLPSVGDDGGGVMSETSCFIFSGTIELPGLGLINTISKVEFPPALQCNRAGAHSYSYSILLLVRSVYIPRRFTRITFEWEQQATVGFCK